MSRVLIDTNALISFLTDRDPVQQVATSNLLNDAASSTIALVVHQAVVTELVYVLSRLYDVADEEINQLLGELLATPGVRPINEVRWRRVLGIWPAAIGDWADALLVAVAIDQGIESIATFDRRLRGYLPRHGLRSYW